MGMTWRIPSSTQTGRAGFWNSVRCTPSFYSVLRNLLLNRIIVDRGERRCVGNALLCCVVMDLTSCIWRWLLNSTWFVSPRCWKFRKHGERLSFLWHDRLKFWLFSSAWRGLWPELLIKSFSSSSPSFSSSLLPCDSHPLLLLLLLVFSGGMYWAGENRKWLKSRSCTFTILTFGKRMSPLMFQEDVWKPGNGGGLFSQTTAFITSSTPQ